MIVGMTTTPPGSSWKYMEGISRISIVLLILIYFLLFDCILIFDLLTHQWLMFHIQRACHRPDNSTLASVHSFEGITMHRNIVNGNRLKHWNLSHKENEWEQQHYYYLLKIKKKSIVGINNNLNIANRHGVDIRIFPNGHISETRSIVVAISQSASSFSFSLTLMEEKKK